ncbi:hypothetical protein EDB86DRAFT_2835780 [Lactarius hatsudake]|nr:hypothetical protein EDB86DRAFT_2835780 [Lactarius hatsudake]
MPGTTNSRQLSEDMGSRPRRLALLVAAGVSLKYPTFLISLAYTNSSEKDPGARLPSLEVNVIPSVFPADLSIDPFRPVSPQDPLHGDATMVSAQTLIARVASDFCHHTCRLIRCVGADIYQGRQDAGVGVAALRLAGCRCWPVEEDVRGREAEGKQFGSRSTRSFSEIPGARECTCPAKTRLHYDPNAALPLRANAAPPLRGLVPAHEYPFVLHQRTRPPSHRIQAERERRRSRYISWNAYALLLFELVPKDGGQVDQERLNDVDLSPTNIGNISVRLSTVFRQKRNGARDLGEFIRVYELLIHAYTLPPPEFPYRSVNDRAKAGSRRVPHLRCPPETIRVPRAPRPYFPAHPTTARAHVHVGREYKSGLLQRAAKRAKQGRRAQLYSVLAMRSVTRRSGRPGMSAATRSGPSTARRGMAVGGTSCAAGGTPGQRETNESGIGGLWRADCRESDGLRGSNVCAVDTVMCWGRSRSREHLGHAREGRQLGGQIFGDGGDGEGVGGPGYVGNGTLEECPRTLRECNMKTKVVIHRCRDMEMGD